MRNYCKKFKKVLRARFDALGAPDDEVHFNVFSCGKLPGDCSLKPAFDRWIVAILSLWILSLPGYLVADDLDDAARKAVEALS